MKKILFVSYDGMTDPLGQSQVLPYLVYLSGLGYQVSLLSFEKKARYNAERSIIESITRDAGIQWHPLFFTSRPPILSKMYDRWQLLRKVRSLYKKERYDLIHCRSYIAAEAGLLLKKKYQVRFLFDMRGFWADEKVDNGQWNLKHPLFNRIYKQYKKKERQFLLQADAIVSLTQAAKDHLLLQPGYGHLPIDVIPCCADLRHFDYHRVTPAQKQALREQLGIAPGRKIITYLGSVGGWYMTKEMFAFYRALQQRYPEFLMLLLTKDDPAMVLQDAAANGLSGEQLIVRYAPRSEVPLYLSISDCSIFFIRATFSKTASSPTKHAELMGMGLPVICNPIGDTGNIIAATQTGLLVDTFSDGSYQQVLTRLPALLATEKEKIRSAAFAYFDLEYGAKKYAAIYQKLLTD